MMPHPERAVQKTLLGSEDGNGALLPILKNFER